MAKASDNLFPKVKVGPAGLVPSAPSDSSWSLYAGVDGVYARSSNTTVGPFGTSGGGAVATDAIWDAAGDLAVGTGANTAARLAIGTSGLLLKSNGTTATWARQTFIGCSAYKNASQTISNDTVTALLLDTEDYDTSAFHDTGSNTSRMTIPSGLDGKYLVTGYAYYDSNTSGQRQLFIQKNGSPVGPTDKRPPISGDNFYHVSHVLSLAATDYVELSTYQDSGGNRTIGDPSAFGDRYKVRFTISLLGV